MNNEFYLRQKLAFLNFPKSVTYLFLFFYSFVRITFCNLFLAKNNLYVIQTNLVSPTCRLSNHCRSVNLSNVRRFRSTSPFRRREKSYKDTRTPINRRNYRPLFDDAVEIPFVFNNYSDEKEF